MRFSSMAVSVLAQTVPLLAVGHLTDWKKREERSRSKSSGLRDALLVGFHDEKGMRLEEHVGVNGKHGDVLEKKSEGSARPVQDGVSTKASVECDPLATANDSGIFICGMDSHCVESKESELGGFCVSSKQTPSIHRALKKCADTPYGEATCDCSQFNNQKGVGSLTCNGEVCGEKNCRAVTNTESLYADGTYTKEDCVKFSGGVAIGLESICYSFNFSSDRSASECKIIANGVECNSCEFNQESCPANSDYLFATAFDCTNTVIGVKGSRCYVNGIYSLVNTR